MHRIVMTKPQKLLALVLAGHADPDGSRVRPGNDRLAAIVGDSEKNVRRVMAVLREDFGLLKVVSRGGGNGRGGKATEFQLTIPVDLLERLEVLPPDCGASGLTGHPVSSQPGDDTAKKAGGPDIQMSSQNAESPVDNQTSHGPQMSAQRETAPDEDEVDRTSDAPSEELTGHPEPVDRTSGCPTTSHDQPPKTTTSGHDPAQPPTAREDQTENDDLPSRHSKCEHGLSAARRADGSPSCPCCRRGIPATLRLVGRTG